MRILIVEDNESIVKALTALLHYQSYAVEVATNGQAAWDLMQAFHYDLILLDIMLPGLDGISLCRQLRSHGFTVPILLLTGRDSGHDKAMGLDAGADDYVVKPFDSKELIARIRALLRRNSSTPASPVLEWEKLRLDPSHLEVCYKAQPMQLTPKEYALLELLMRYPKRVFSCDAILEHIWSFENTPTEEAVRTQIKGLRQKLKAVGAPSDLIETVYGIGYRLKPLSPISVNSNSVKKENQQQLSPGLAEAQIRWKERINQHVTVLEQTATAYLQQAQSQELRTFAEQEAQTLVASLCHYGLNKGAQLARTIKHSLQLTHPSNKEAKYLHKLVMALRKEIDSSSEGLVSKLANSKDGRSKLLIVDCDCQLARELAIRSEAQGILAEVATTLSEVRDKIACVRPDAVLLDPIVGNTIEESFALLSELLLQTPPVPIVVFTRDSNFDTRLEVARLGGRTFLQKPMPANEAIQVVTHIMQPTHLGSTSVVMVVDSDPRTPTTLQTLLEPWGLKAIVENNPRQFWDTLEASAPDLLILNLDMPNLNGIELCQVVRNDVRWGGLPILFLANYIDATTIHQIFAAGADDFVSNPIVGPELVTRILHRLERTKLQRSLAEIDPLTRVYNRHRATQDLNKLLRLSLRHNQPMCLAILEIDNFKQINSDFGHASGDIVLRQLGQLLQQSFRGEDVVSRWTGEEFVIGMYGMTRSQGLQRVLQILESIHEYRFSANNVKFQVTASAGVAQYFEDGDDLQSLYKSANIALGRAKAIGCNCASPTPTQN